MKKYFKKLRKESYFPIESLRNKRGKKVKTIKRCTLNIFKLFAVLQRPETRGGRGKNVGKALTTPAAQEREVTRGTSQGESFGTSHCCGTSQG